ncbi:MAG: DivIVA domain-containing protein [Oscillospiraceae bacterium]
MLTPEKIKGKEFQTTGRGSYRADDVDSFIAEVSSSYDQMFKENGELIKKISILANKIEEYRKDEDSLRTALFAAQKLADQIVKEANDSIKGKVDAADDTAKEIVDNANKVANELKANAKNEADGVILSATKQAEEILGTVNRKITHESLAFEMLQKEASEFRSKLIDMYKEHLNLINKLPEIAEDELASEEPKVEANEQEIEKSEVAEEIEEVEEVEEVEEAFEIAEEAIAEEAIEDEAEEDDEETFEEFTLEEIADDNDFEDISSSSEKDDEDGFSLNLDDMDFDDEPVEEVHTNTNYAVADDFETVKEEEIEDDDEDGPVSFKSFFKKK